MKSMPSHTLSRALFALACLCPFALHATTISESFDRKPDPKMWTLGAEARVLDGELLLTASGSAEGYPTTVMQAKEPQPALNFMEHFVRVTFTDLTVAGEGLPANNVFMAIIASNEPSEMRARSYIKLRISGDGLLMINCADLTGDRSRDVPLGNVQVKFPISRLELELTLDGFRLKGIAGSRPFEQSARWNGRVDMDAWAGVAPYFFIKSVRRPGEGYADVRLGEMTVVSE